MALKLNGWQRLWVVLTIVYLLTVAWISSFTFPKASNYLSTRVYDSLDAVGHYLEKEQPGFRYEGGWATRTKYYADLPEEQIVPKLHEKYQGRVDFSPIETRYRQAIEGLAKEKLRFVGVAFLVWLTPVVAFYLLGWAAGWVLRGFKHNDR